MHRHLPFVLALAILLVSKAAHADDWPQWRGPGGNSVSTETNLPLAWNSSRGVVWSTELPQWGTSSPCIWEDSIFVTSDDNGRLLLTKVVKSSGEIAWTKEVGQGEAKRMPLRLKTDEERREQRFHDLHNLASPSPVTDGNVVVAHFGSGDLAAFDFDGNQLWHRNLQEDHGTYTIWWGHANSPVIYQDLLISVSMQDSLEGVSEDLVESYVVAHDLRTGTQRWKTLRMTGAAGEENDAYTTPVIAQTDGGDQVIIMGGNVLDAYDPKTGKQLWFLPNVKGGRTVSGPTVAGGLVYATQGQAGPLLAVELGGSGELSRDAIVWRQNNGTPDSCCPVVWEDLLFTITDAGVARCYDARTGKIHWTQRIGGDFKASPVAADGRVYLLSTSGVCTIIAASPKFEKLTASTVEDETLSSPAISDGRIYIRGKKALYCVGKL